VGRDRSGIKAKLIATVQDCTREDLSNYLLENFWRWVSNGLWSEARLPDILVTDRPEEERLGSIYSCIWNRVIEVVHKSNGIS
jgi:hypothetical protein